MDGNTVRVHETPLGTNANLEEWYRPDAQDVYTADQDNGEFRIHLEHRRRGDAFTGIAILHGNIPAHRRAWFSFRGDRLYAVMQGQAVFTYSRNTSTSTRFDRMCEQRRVLADALCAFQRTKWLKPGALAQDMQAQTPSHF